jgi:hypothetical protein
VKQQGLILESGQKLKKKFAHQNELDIRKPLVTSISQGSKELRLYNPVSNLTISIYPWPRSGIFKCISWYKDISVVSNLGYLFLSSHP